MSNIIPFGKYKGQPVEVLSSDPDYVQWFLSQQGIKTKYPELVQIIINNFQEPSETPEHNAIQVKFINKDFRTKFATYVSSITTESINDLLSSISTKVDKYSERIIPKSYLGDEKNIEIKRETDVLIKTNTILEKLKGIVFKVNNVEFESDGADVSFRSNIDAINHLYYDDPDHNIMDDLLDELEYFHYTIEIKPVVSDDFPAVLRQMKMSNSNILFLTSYTGVGASREEFINYFKSQGIKVVFESELEGFELPSINFLLKTKT